MSSLSRTALVLVPSANDTTTASGYLTSGATPAELEIVDNIVQVDIYVIFDTNVWYCESPSGKTLLDIELAKEVFEYLR